MLPALRTEDPQGVAAVFQRAHAEPNSQGRFWRIERSGIAPSYLLGTFHTEQAIKTVTQDMWDAFDAARIAVFEMNAQEQDRLQTRIADDPAFALDPTLPALLGLVSEEQRTILTKAFTDRGLPVEAANHMKPWLLAGLLGFPACHIRASQQGAEPMDTVMAKRAHSAGRPTVSIENYEEALASFGVLDRDSLISLLIADEDLANNEEDIFATHTALYAAGETVAINELAIWLSQREDVGFDVRALNMRLMESLLVRRNRTWLPRLDRILQDGNAFVAVGALHLPGQDGLITLLRYAGYTVTRLD